MRADVVAELAPCSAALRRSPAMRRAVYDQGPMARSTVSTESLGGSKAESTVRQSVYSPKKAVSRLPANSTNVLIIMLDDVGPALPEV